MKFRNLAFGERDQRHPRELQMLEQRRDVGLIARNAVVRAYIYSLFVAESASAKLPVVQAHLMEALQGSWEGKTFTRDEIDQLAGSPDGLRDKLAVADRLAPILTTAPNIAGNPRIVKRLLNAVTLRQTLAAQRKMNVDLATLAKLAVFERGTNEGAVRLLYRTVMTEGADEKLLLPVERGGEAELPSDWKGYEPFIEQWRAMEPIFEDVAVLRAAMFLSRDVMAPAVARSGLSQSARDAVTGLFATASATSPEGKAIVERLPESERPLVMGALISKLREADWSDKAPGFHGAIILADASAEARKDLQAFISTLSTQGMDEEAARLAVGEALFEVFGDAEFFDPTTVNDVGLFVAVRCFVAELVFASLTAEAGSAADRVPPAVAVARENGLRDLVREVTDHVATPILQNAGAMLAPEAVENVVIAVTDAVIAEMKEWE